MVFNTKSGTKLILCMLKFVSVLQIAQIKILKQKQMKFSSKSLIILMVSFAWTLQAQYDDVYYNGNSSSVRKKSRTVSNSNYGDDDLSYYNSNRSDNEYYDEYSTQHDSYDADNYNYYNEDYAYTNRIRRFSRPLMGRSFYDPYYLDPWYFDPYYYTSGFGFSTPWVSFGFYSYNDYWRWNRWNRWNRFRYFDPWTYSYNPFGYSGFGFNNWAFNSWCPTSWYSNRYYYNTNYWGNSYNNVYQPKYYTDNNVHFGPRTYGATTTSDRGPSRSSGRIFSDPGTPGYNPNANPGDLRRTSPRETEVTTVRERNTPLSRQPQGDISNDNTSGANSRMSPRNNDNNVVRERNQSTERVRTFRDYDNGTNNSGATSPRSNDNGSRPSPRINDNSTRSRNFEPSSPRSFERNEGYDNDRSIRSNRSTESPRFEAPRQQSPRFEAPRQQSPRFESPRHESPRFESPRSESPRFDSPRSSGNSNFGGGSPSSSPSSPSPRSSPRDNQ